MRTARVAFAQPTDWILPPNLPRISFFARRVSVLHAVDLAGAAALAVQRTSSLGPARDKAFETERREVAQDLLALGAGHERVVEREFWGRLRK